jgi:putative transport protein
MAPRSAPDVLRSAAVVDFLVDEPLLLLLIVMGLGAGLGTIHVHGISIGPAAALFAGLAVGAIDDSLSEAPGLDILRELGLVLFTYTVGIASGPSFFAALRRGGLASVAVVVALVGTLAGATAAIGSAVGLSEADRTGVFAGATTNTPALQAATDAVDSGNPVVAYSLTYPVAVVAMLAVLTLVLQRRLRLPAPLDPPPVPRVEPLVSWTVRCERDDLPSLGELRACHTGVRFSRVEHGGTVSLGRDTDAVVPGDLLAVVGPEPAVTALCRAIGQRSDRHLPLDRTALDFRRVVVSNRRLAGERVVDLDLEERFGVSATRLRRGDVDAVVDDTTTIALGDRVRIVGPPDALARAARELGDSERRLSELDGAGFAAGIALGLCLGAVAIPLPGEGDLRLGAGGGALVAGLVLGRVSRLGPLTFQLPLNANHVLRQLGILGFLGAAGLGSGTAFAEAVGSREGLELMLVGGLVATGFALLAPLVVTLALRRDPVDAAGFFAGLETQPAALAYAADRTEGDERVNMAYALAFPVAMIVKILVVQLLV